MTTGIERNLRRVVSGCMLLGAAIVYGPWVHGQSMDLGKILSDIHPEVDKWATVTLVKNPESHPEFSTFHLKNEGEAVDFWPASTIKLYTVIAGVEFLNQYGMPLDTIVAFSRPGSNGAYQRDCARTFEEMVSEVFRRSSNEDYTLLLRMIGIDAINTQFLVPDKGFPHSALMRDYVTYRPVVYENNEPQRIELISPGGIRKTIDHQWSGISYAERRGATILSSTTGNCTSTAELADCLRRILFHDHIPEKERFNITSTQAEFIRLGDPSRGLIGLENRLAGAYGWEECGEKIFPQARYFHKSGLISNYVLDVGYLSDEASDTFILFALAAHTGEEQVLRNMAHAIYSSLQ